MRELGNVFSLSSTATPRPTAAAPPSTDASSSSSDPGRPQTLLGFISSALSASTPAASSSSSLIMSSLVPFASAAKTRTSNGMDGVGTHAKKEDAKAKEEHLKTLFNTTLMIALLEINALWEFNLGDPRACELLVSASVPPPPRKHLLTVPSASRMHAFQPPASAAALPPTPALPATKKQGTLSPPPSLQHGFPATAPTPLTTSFAAAAGWGSPPRSPTGVRPDLGEAPFREWIERWREMVMETVADAALERKKSFVESPDRRGSFLESPRERMGSLLDLSEMDRREGGVAGAVSRTTVAPLERLKILLQTHVLPPNMPVGKALVQMVRTDGVIGLFKGNGVNVLRIVPYSAVQFASYEWFKRTFKELSGTEGELTTWLRLAAGASAGMCSVTATYPLDLLRTRLAMPPASSSATPARSTLLTTAVRVVREEGGVVALYRGLSASLVGVAPYMALNLVLYEALRAEARTLIPGLEDTGSKEDVTAAHVARLALVRLACGATAGAIAQTAAYPLEVIRRKMQVMGMRKDAAKAGKSGYAIVDVTLKVWKEEGVPGFYRGLVPNLIKVVPAAAVSFMTYETTKSFLKTAFEP
ncbi:hypothetical protein HDU96_009946 [Phlyctochytrium bullatum]|nr:hypothetical protein HDU96_009946 [Phlyctochytrium bullatum]